MSINPHPLPEWSSIDTVCLDLDGTLLDQAYDNHIWRDLVPQRFAVAHGLDMHAAYAEIARRFDALRGTLSWYCVEHWSRDLGVDIGALHREVRSHVAWLPGARDFLARLRGAGKRLLLLTNSHPIALAVKHQQSGVLDYLDGSATSHDFGSPQGKCRVLGCGGRTLRFRPGPQPVRGRQFADAGSRPKPGSAGCTAYGTGTRKGSRREHIRAPGG